VFQVEGDDGSERRLVWCRVASDDEELCSDSDSCGIGEWCWQGGPLGFGWGAVGTEAEEEAASVVAMGVASSDAEYSVLHRE